MQVKKLAEGIAYLFLLIVHSHLESIEWIIGARLLVSVAKHSLDLLGGSASVPRPPGCRDTDPSTHRRSSYIVAPVPDTRSERMHTSTSEHRVNSDPLNLDFRGATAAAPSDSVFRALCINWLTYLLTYSPYVTHGVNRRWQKC